MNWGAQISGSGVRFRLWAPSAQRVGLKLVERGETIAMPAIGDGWFEYTDRACGHGMRYLYEIDGELLVPDPASRFQPEGLDGPSEVVDLTRYRWPAATWSPPPFERLVFYELHVGTFTPQGTYAAAAAHLPELAELGITAVELMPIAQAPGNRNWGYDGVLHYAPSHTYGTPDDLRNFIAAAHAQGIAVFLDVVYNHFGPQGNYLYRYARRFFTDEHHTPWGNAIDYGSDGNTPVRRYAIDNALYWLRDYRFDGLRLDAVQAIYDDSPSGVLRDLAGEVRRYVPGQKYLVVENDDNSAALLESGYDAQWNDDVHHILHLAITGEGGGYYQDYADHTTALLGRALTSGFAYQGETSAFRSGKRRGEPSASLRLRSFVNFLQNHDQIGNRALGERITQIAPAQAVRAALAVVLLAPSPPLLFMGEEWGASTPFLFFCDFEPELARAVTKGRRNEFSVFPEFADAAARERIPDPCAPQTFEDSRLRWEERREPEHAQWLGYYRELLRLRRTRIAPFAANLRGSAATFSVTGDRGLAARWRLDNGRLLLLDANLGASPCKGFAEQHAGQAVFATHGAVYAYGIAPPWSIRWTIA